MNELEKYEFKELLKEINDCKGRATELISLYIPGKKLISDVVAYLRNEYSQSSNIKSKSTRKNVTQAIESLISRLRYYKQAPENGLALFVGHKSIGSDRTDFIAYTMEKLPEPLSTFLYRCDSQFYVEPLETMLEQDEIYGLLLIDRREATIGLLNGSRIELITHMTSQVPGKHGRGGQSQRSFERLIEIAAHEFFKKAGEAANEAFISTKNLKGILAGGPGPTKDYFLKEEYLRKDVMDKMLGSSVDTGYTDEYGLRELVNNCRELIANSKIAKEKKILERFFHETIKENGLVVYGDAEVMEKLELGKASDLIIAEGLKKTRYVCPNCGAEIEEGSKNCKNCSSELKTKKEEDIIHELAELASHKGVKIHFVSQNTEEGGMFVKAFGGIGALLRY